MVKRYVGNAVFTEDGHGEKIEGQSFKCPSCKACGCKGHISAGTVIEIQCRRCKLKYVLKGI